MTQASLESQFSVRTRGGYPSFSTKEIECRHAALRRVMEDEGVDLAIAFGAGRFNQEMLYLTNWPGGREGYFLLPLDGDGTLLLQFFNHVPLAKQLSLIADTRWAGASSSETVGDEARRRGARRLGLIGPWRAHDRDQLAALLPHAELVDLTARYRSLRLYRSEEEMALFRAAAELTDRSMEALEAEVRPGLREYELAAIVEDVYLRLGGQAAFHYMSSTPMAHPTAYVPHQYLSDRTISHGDVLLTEISGSYWGYASQIHRTYVVGAEPSAEYRRLEAVAEEAYDAVIRVLRDGATVEDVLDAAQIIHQRGYTIVDDLLHGADQYPPILRTWETDHGHPEGFVFRENMVVTVQPHVTTRDYRAGLQLGETVRITREGVERLHRYRRGMIVVPA